MKAIIFRKQRSAILPALSVLVGAAALVAACGGKGGKADDSDRDDSAEGGGGGLGGSANTGNADIDSETVVEAAALAASMSDDDLNAAIAALDLDLQMAQAQKSGLVTELGGEQATRSLLLNIGIQMQVVVAEFEAGTLFGTNESMSGPTRPPFDPKWPGVPVQADGGLGEAFGAGWLGGSLFNGAFVDKALSDYANGKSGIDMSSSSSGDVTATAGLTDTKVILDATARFSLDGLSATIGTQSGVPCPDVNGLMIINSSLDVTGQAGNSYQNARFSFELIVEVDDDATLTGKNQLKSTTTAHTADSSNGYETTDASVDVSVTEFSDGSFGDGKGSYKGMTEKDALGWMNMGQMSGMLYRKQLLPHLQKMLDAGRCVNITVEPSAGPMNLEPFTNVDLLTKPRAKISHSGVTTGGTVQASFKKNAGGAIAESGSKVPADATFHYVSPLDYGQTETVTFEARSRRGTGKLDYTLTTSPHAD